ncbi:MAG: ribosomal RNA small subunit methyltransferase H [Pseudomonadota bacterium]|nr:MAG: ribosomal RNA small subunit methyltransferase H [Pseudomonadota bacterium]
MLKELSRDGRVIALDRDPQAIAVAKALQAQEPRLEVVQGRFAELGDVIARCGIAGAITGALMDVGVSSPQLDDAQRGFSFRHDGPLDMRMDPSQGVGAAEWLNSAEESDIADVIWRYGEERRSRRIAKAIVSARPLHTTQQLAEVVAKSVPRTHRPATKASKHPATKTFQAIRIFINDELNELKQGLQAAFDNLATGGRLAVISFHSLEDREVKRAFKALSRPPALPRRLPVPENQAAVSGRLVSGPIRAGHAELQENPRARSATLRVIERVV